MFPSNFKPQTSFFHLIHPSRRRGETLVLDQHLVHDGAEIGAVGAIPGGADGVGDVADSHRLTGAAEHGLHHGAEAFRIAGASAAAAVATGNGATAGATQRAARGAPAAGQDRGGAETSEQTPDDAGASLGQAQPYGADSAPAYHGAAAGVGKAQ